MDALHFVLEILILLVIIIGGLLFRHFLPSYIGKKGENLATREDIQSITGLTEEIQDEFRRKFDEFTKEKVFKYEYYYTQFRELYARLYAIIAQSEYTRRFFKLYNGTDLTFEELPFVEVHKAHKEPTICVGERTGISYSETEVKDGITEFCKKSVCDLIIEKGEYASQSLIKLAVAYRFAHDNYSGTVKNGEAVEVSDEEESKLIREMLLCIVKEYNFIRKELRLEYIESEFTSGMFEKIQI